jgi:spermidine/putrescine transport system substrate-binding protein
MGGSLPRHDNQNQVTVPVQPFQFKGVAVSMYNRRLLYRSLLMFALVLLVFGSAAQTKAQKRKLHVYNWTTYIADNTIADFEKKYDVEVTYDTYTDMGEMYSKFQSGNPGYDVIVPGNDYVPIMIQADLLEPLDLSKIPNFANLAESFKNPAYDPGNQYSIAYQWGTIGIGYSSTKIGKDIVSYKDMFAPELRGRVMVLESNRETLAMFLNFLGKDPNSTNPEDLQAVKDFFIEHKDWIVAFHEADAQFAIAKGDVDAATVWSGDMFQVIGDPANAELGLKYVIPAEGGLLWTDNLAIPKGAPDVDLAHTFIDFILDAQVGADISNYTQYGSPNQASIDQGLISKELLENPAIYPPADVLAKCFILKDLGDALTLYDEIWAEIKAEVSK